MNCAVAVFFSLYLLPASAIAHQATNLTELETKVSEAQQHIVALDFVASKNGRIHGWVEQPSIRGTWDIIWSCLVTTFICTYTLISLNIPAPSDTRWTLVRRRFFWMIFGIFAPEIVLTFAAGQWSRAKHSVDAFHKAGYRTWTLRLAFFADMGGFFLKLPDCDSFPLNAKQLYWLVENKIVPYPETTGDEIWDKSKQDSLAKYIIAFQVSYLILQSIGRLVQGLAITTLELNTIAIVACSLMTAFAWFDKPSDVATPIHLCSALTTLEITEQRAWDNTPLDFVDENGPGWSMNVQPFIGLPTIPDRRPIQRIPNDRFPMAPYGLQEYFLCFATLVFTGLHVSGWNLPFPSYTEMVLWRTASLILFGVTALFWVLETIAAWSRLGRWKWVYLWLTNPESLPRFERATAERLAEEKPREMSTVPQSWEFWSIAPIAVLYGIARVYQLVEGFMELREIDATAFVQVDWSRYFPHI